MKKLFILLSTTYLLAILFTGCTTNLFQSLDTSGDTPTSVALKADAEEALNSGNYSEAITKLDEILAKDFAGVTSCNDLNNDPEKRKTYMELMSKKGESYLGLAGVETLKIVKTLSDISANITVDSAVQITDILDTIDLAAISKARDAFNAGLPDSQSLKTSDDVDALKSNYQSASIAFALTAAANLNTMKTSVEALDPAKSTYTADLAAVNNQWDNLQTPILTDLTRAADCINVAFPSSSTDTNAIDIKSLEAIKTKVTNADSIDEKNFDEILSGLN